MIIIILDVEEWRTLTKELWLDPQGTLQEIEIWPYKPILIAQTRVCPREWDAKNSLGFWDTNGSPITSQKIRPRDN